jgi:hypothetical protein
MRGGARRDSARHGRARLGTEKTLLCLLLPNRGNVSRLQLLHGVNTPQYVHTQMYDYHCGQAFVMKLEVMRGGKYF